MHRASKAELCIYLAAVGAVAVVVCRQSYEFSSASTPAIIQASGTASLPVRLTSILDISPDYIARHHPALQQTLARYLPQPDPKPSGFDAALLRASSVPVVGLFAGLLQRFLSLPRDVSDVQWREFRSSLALLAAGMMAYVTLSHLARQAGQGTWRVACLVACLGFLGVLHGAQAAWPLLLACCSFQLSQLLAGRRYGPVVMWTVQITLLVGIRHYNGFSFATMSQHLSWLDSHRGMLRWHIHHNLAMLRVLSYFMDLHWARQQANSNRHWDKASMAVPRATYRSLLLYILYCFYPPLYIAGPVITYNSWASQVTSTSTSRVNKRQVVTYCIRWLISLTVLEVVTRTLHFNALAKHGLLTRGVLQAYGVEVSSLHYAYTGFWVLVFMWLKFLVIWRFFRAVALADGVDAPENMRRCVCNNYDVQGFWQGWHSSYNRWLVRYVYVPLGGSTWRWANVWVCFLFVALWHDLDYRLLAWGLIMPAAFIPEMAVKALGRSRALSPHAHQAWFRHVAALLGCLNVLALMSANLVGFVVGVDGLVPLLKQVLGQPSVACVVVGVLWCAVQLMFALREQEARWRRREGAGEMDLDRKQGHGE